MKALQIVGAGQVSIQDVDPRSPEVGEVLVKIHAAALNRRDHWIREGKYPNINFNRTLGSDGCGEVVEVGSDQHKHLLGKMVVINPNVGWGANPEYQAPTYQVLGMPTDGTIAEYITVASDRVVQKPEHLSAAEAAAMPLAGLTAFRAVFNHGKLEPNQDVLITGIGGGVSQMAFLFAKAHGGIVSVTSGSNDKLETMRKFGAKNAFNYREEWERQALADNIRFDLVIDSVGGAQLNSLIKLIKPAGKIVFYGATTGLTPKLDLYRLFWNQVTLQGSTMGNDQEFEEMISFVSKHQLHPMIDSQWPIDQAEEAMDMMRDAAQLGKLVITFGE